MKFIDDSHSYINTNNQSYRSVTSLLKKLEKEKNWDEIAKKYAKKHNIPLEQVKTLWQKEKDDSIVRGKKYHSSAEAQDLSQEYAVVMSDTGERITLPVYKSVIVNGTKIESKQELPDGVYPELMLWIDEYQIAGQADKIIIHNKLIDVIDYKTNKKIEKTGWVDFKTGKTHKLLYPCEHLDECNFSIYSLQMNFYAYIIKYHNPGYRIGKMIIKHIMFDEKGEPMGVKDYLVPNLQKEIKMILDGLKIKK